MHFRYHCCRGKVQIKLHLEIGKFALQWQCLSLTMTKLCLRIFLIIVLSALKFFFPYLVLLYKKIGYLQVKIVFFAFLRLSLQFIPINFTDEFLLNSINFGCSFLQGPHHDAHIFKIQLKKKKHIAQSFYYFYGFHNKKMVWTASTPPPLIKDMGKRHPI